MDHDALANKLAALSDALAERAHPPGDELGPTDVAALVALQSSEPMSVTSLAAATGLSQSAAVRLVDRLERAWLVRRQRRISREVLVDLTQRGHKRAETLAGARLAAAEIILAALSDDERAFLSGLIDRMATALAADPAFDRTRHCRFCRRECCDCGLHPANESIS